MLRECDRTEGSVCYCTPKNNGLVNGTPEVDSGVKHLRVEPPTIAAHIDCASRKFAEDDSSEAITIWAGLKHAFRRSEDGSFFAQFSTWQMLTIAAAEMLGTAILLFLGCMGLIKGLSNEDPPHLQVSLAFGLVVASVIQIIGHISKAHLNPAVTVCAVLLGDINIPTALVYFVAECVGAIIGFGLLRSITPDDVWSGNNCCQHCVTLPGPGVTDLQGLLAEILVTSVLIFLVCATWDKRNSENQDSAALKFGFLIASISMVEGHYTGASMNPARSLAPALWTGVWRSHWIYWVGPILASIVATLIYKFVFNRDSEKEDLADNEMPLTTVNSGQKDGLDISRQVAERTSKEDLAL